MHDSPHTIDAEKWRSLVMRLRVWLCEVLVWLADWFGDHPVGREVRAELRADLRDAERGVRAAIVLIALARVRWSQSPGDGTRRPDPVVRSRSRADLRHVTRIIRFRARTLRARAQRLRDVIDDLDRHVARMVKRLEAGLRQLAPIFIVLLAMRAGLAMTDAALADSS